MKTLTTIFLALGLMVFAASAAQAGPSICVNNDSGTVRIVPSCTVGTNLSPCRANETCFGSLNGQPFATNESWSSCSGSLCIDAPHPDGTGGWGRATSLTSGTSASLTVTVMQPSSTPLCGSGTGTITLTYSSQDFSLSDTDSRGVTGTNPFLRGGVETFTYTGNFWCHTAQSVAYTFTPLNATNTALVTATVTVGGQQVSETFPVMITPAPPAP